MPEQPLLNFTTGNRLLVETLRLYLRERQLLILDNFEYLLPAAPVLAGFALPYALTIPPGETATLVYIFDKPGTLLYGCHITGHYTAGMKGTITIPAALLGLSCFVEKRI